MDTISGIFAPVLGAMAGAGMLKALLILLTTVGAMTAEMGTYRILYAAADGVFVFIPVFLPLTAARKFRCNEYVAIAIAAALLYPDLTAAYADKTALTFLKISGCACLITSRPSCRSSFRLCVHQAGKC
jgi:PTS system beta-glucosides-specific IIC component